MQRLKLLSSQLQVSHQLTSMTSFEGKVIAITGAASGIGLATAHLLAARGAAISIADVRDEPLKAAVESIQKMSPNTKLHSKTVNVSSSKEVDAWTEEIVSHFGKIDGAANLAGVTGKSTTSTFVADVEEDDFDFIISVNLKGVFNCMKSQLKRMKNGANIVNAASAAGIRGYAMSIAYCASKVLFFLLSHILLLFAPLPQFYRCLI